MEPQLQTQYYMLLGLLEEAGSAVKGAYERHLAALDSMLKDIMENEGGKGSDSYGAFIIALQLFLIKQVG